MHLEDFYQVIADEESFAIYCAGEFASLLVHDCLAHGYGKKLQCCIVTRRDGTVPPHIQGVEVVELEDVQLAKETLIVVAVTSKRAQSEIAATLKEAGWKHVLLLTKQVFQELNWQAKDFSVSCRDILFKMNRRFDEVIGLNHQILQKQRSMQYLFEMLPLVVKQHTESFGEFKGAFAGKTVVICGTGPTLNQYKFNDDFIHIGMNSIMFDKEKSAKLDFYFNQHIPDISEASEDDDPMTQELKSKERERRKLYLENLEELSCTAFIGQSVGDLWRLSPPYDEYSHHKYRKYYNYDQEDYHFLPDIRYAFMHGSYSVLFPAVQFALFGEPDTIYLVGCDGYKVGENSYFSKKQADYAKKYLYTDQKKMRDIDANMRRKYRELQDFAKYAYPRTKIIMVNPRYFSGFFEETVTDADGNIVER